MTYYDEISTGYDELHKEEQEKKLAIIAQHLHVQPHESLLDVGCGSGIGTRYFTCKRKGIDTSVKLIEIARRKDASGEYHVGRAEQLPFKDHEFDYVISITAIHNFDDYKKAISEMIRVGKNFFAITVLKRSPLAKEINTALLKTFSSIFKNLEKIDQEKDIIYIIQKNEQENL